MTAGEVVPLRDSADEPRSPAVPWRYRFVARVSRIWRWEFWPAWLFYAPVAVWIAWLSIRRGGLRGFASITAANPCLPDGGFVGESKGQILAMLPAQAVIPFRVVAPGEPAERADRIRHAADDAGWTLPLILKPDVGQRGQGVRLARTWDAVRNYVETHPAELIVQPYHPGPFEVGVFYFRQPGESAGRIFSITEKVFPAVVGDGVRTVAERIWRHPRYRMQARRFLERLGQAADAVPPAGQRVPLAVAGNHCQGTLFQDGWRLWTPALEQAIDRVAQGASGFHFGRFDLRYRDEAAFCRGEEIAVVELNGVTSESTDIYDPRGSLWRAWAKLIRQWNVLFQIADANIARGARPMPWRGLWRRVQTHRMVGKVRDDGSD
jgi:hypothetical protein